MTEKHKEDVELLVKNVQLEKLVPQLISQVTGSVSRKPDWWPKSIDWIDPGELTLTNKNPCETLREIVRSCYQHSEKENLLYVDDSFTRSMPASALEEEVIPVKPRGHPQGSFNHRVEETVQKGEAVEDIDQTPGCKDIHTQNQTIGETEGNTLVIIDTNGDTQLDTDNMLQEKATSPKRGCNPCEPKTCDAQANDMKNLMKPRMPVEIIVCEEEGGVDFKQDKQDGAQSGTKLAGPISPRTISEIDKHILDSIASKYLNFENTRPGIKQQAKKDGKSIVPELTISLQSKTSGQNGSLSGPKRPGNIISKGEPMDTKNDCSETVVRKDAKPKELDREMPSLTMKVPGDKEKSEPVQNTQDDDEVVWICFICAKGFPNQTDLMSHQDVCEEEGTQGNDMGSGVKDSVNTGGEMAPAPSIETQKPTDVKSEVTDQPNHADSKAKPIPALLRKVGSDLKALPLGLSTLSRIFPTRKRKRNKEIYIPPPRDTYFECLGLVPTPKVEQIKTPQKSGKSDCQIIDLTLDEDLSPQPQPMTPRTHLIMSQLSREETPAGRRRQLSFSQMTPPKAAKKVVSDSESSDSSVEERVSRKNVPCKSVILAIPLTSLLGQRLKKHWQSDNKIPIISDIEVFCQTSNVLYYNNISEMHKKNKFTEKLRHRPPPQVTFKYTKKYTNKWFHKFKFNRADKREFGRTLETGLERESRRLLKKMKKCKVSLERMSEKDIRLRTHPVPKPHQYMSNLQLMRRNYNDQIRMGLLQSLPRSTRPALQLHRPSGMHNVQFRPRVNAPLPLFAQRGPIPQFLVRNIPNGANRFNMEVLPVVHKIYSQPAGTSMFVPSDRSKQAFQNLTMDDNTVICLSSDEEEETSPAPCGKCKLSREACTCQGHTKPRIGPASFMKHQQSLQQRAQVLRKSAAINQTSSPVSMIINTGKVDSASSRVFGKHYVKSSSEVKTHPSEGSHLNTDSNQGAVQRGQEVLTNCPQDTNIVYVSESTTGDSSSPKLKSGFTHIQMVNGKIVQQVTENSTSLSGTQLETTSVQEPGSPSQAGSSTPLSDSEYMDFEVICIDSDEDS